MAQRHVVVVGGGVIGTSCAYYLARDGFQVTVLDSRRHGAACSYGNCGLLAYSHVMPLNAPGAIRNTIDAMLRPNSPFSIKPRIDFTLWHWLLKFATHCTAHRCDRSAHTLARLLQSTARLYEQLFQDESIDCELEKNGCLYVFRNAKAFATFEQSVLHTTKNFGVGAQRYPADELRDVEPSLCEDVMGGWRFAMDCHVRPDKLVTQWRTICEQRGVVFREHCQATGFTGQNSADAVVCGDYELQADAFVIATGAESPYWNKSLGCRLPIQPGKGYSITVPSPSNAPRQPTLFHDHKVVVTPMESAFRIGSTMEFSGYDKSLPRKRLQLLRDAASMYLREPLEYAAEETWFGWRAMTYDGLPIIGPGSKLSNVWIATGHNMLGLTLAPVTGKLISEMISKKEPHLDIMPLGIDRF